MRYGHAIFISVLLSIGGIAQASSMNAELNADRQKFVSANGKLAVTIDFAGKRFLQNAHFTPLDPDYLARGDFYPIGDDQCLWVLKRIVSVPANWRGGSGAGSAGVGSQTPVLMLFAHGRAVYTLSYGQLGFRNLVASTGSDGEIVNAWYRSAQVMAPERVVLYDLPRAKAANGAGVEVRLLTGALRPLPPGRGQ